jgi:hypothetical protein
MRNMGSPLTEELVFHSKFLIGSPVKFMGNQVPQ